MGGRSMQIDAMQIDGQGLGSMVNAKRHRWLHRGGKETVQSEE